ncbi:MAG: DUF433 domain-containing protein [Polyangia bacterium]|nr:DUF433 domain-containing protein [Polyangia bacterium]
MDPVMSSIQPTSRGVGCMRERYQMALGETRRPRGDDSREGRAPRRQALLEIERAYRADRGAAGHSRSCSTRQCSPRPVIRARSLVMDYRDRIVRDQNICGGEPVIRGTRVTLRTVLASLEDGDGFEEILAAYPSLTRTDVAAVIAFAASSAREDLLAPCTPDI